MENFWTSEQKRFKLSGLIVLVLCKSAILQSMKVQLAVECHFLMCTKDLRIEVLCRTRYTIFLRKYFLEVSKWIVCVCEVFFDVKSGFSEKD